MGSGASAVAAGNFLNFAEHSVVLIKRYLAERNEPIRLDSYVSYEKARVGEDGRLVKYPDSELDALRFRYIAEEKI